MPAPNPQNRLWISDTALPSASAVTSAIVSPSACSGARASTGFVGQSREMTVLEQGRGVHVHPVGVREVPVTVPVGCVDHPRDPAGVRTVEVGLDPEALEKRQDLEQHEPLGVGRDDAHVPVPVRRTERREHARVVPREVVVADRRPAAWSPAT